MRALVMTAPSDGTDRTDVEEIAEPRPGEGQVSIDVTYAGVNFMDVMARRGDPGYASSWPYVPGLEVAGTVRELGAGVSGLAVGQRVVAFTAGGGFAEVAIARAALTVPVPDEISLLTAAGTPMVFSTALLLLTDAARLSSGESVLVHSAGGGVGSALAQLVPALGGGLLIGTVGRPDKTDSARQSGYDIALARGADLVDSVRAATKGNGVNVVLDPLGTSLVDVDLDITAPGGRIVLFGNAGGGQPAPLPPLGKLIGGNVAIGGFSITSLSRSAPERVAAALRRVLELISAGRLDVAVTDIGSLAGVPAVHQLLADGRGSGKYVARVA
ncbi:zinc-binding dehydrogenase [Nonomuraea phyllanthi]|uniref:Zinc-binding dehydrogenase n=1 Tax=Nonomuraea phyllanthi TaxID=2219224 RepID=A0A5C4VCY7_9ACTN|nr:zinc-binding dehydrogenase [Nonomuraea phyllanthi]QFY09839.1 zinc-binding dehydrogenase [Nonomuraea phyllanthi]